MSRGRIKAKQKKDFQEISGEFNTNDGWLNKFKKRQGIRHLKISGESPSTID